MLPSAQLNLIIGPSPRSPTGKSLLTDSSTPIGGTRAFTPLQSVQARVLDASCTPHRRLVGALDAVVHSQLTDGACAEENPSPSRRSAARPLVAARDRATVSVRSEICEAETAGRRNVS